MIASPRPQLSALYESDETAWLDGMAEIIRWAAPRNSITNTSRSI